MTRDRPSFETLFGRVPEARGEAPGRANLIGEHTDYNGGLVLPFAIPQRTRVELAARADGMVRAASADMGAPGEVLEYRLGEEAPDRGWLDYVQGVTRALASEGHVVGGFDARIGSEIPPGAGLSSSAALEVALLRALREAFALRLADVPLALVAQRAENDLVGARVGIMDPLAVALGTLGEALFIDTRTLAFRRVPLPDSAELAVVHSGILHANAKGGYNLRRAECERACALLGVTQLRDLEPGDLPRAARLPDPLGRRVRHVVTENARVTEAVDALEGAYMERLGRLLDASHASLRDDYEVSLPEIDLLVELARGDARAHGARITGGGFGGSVVILTRRGAARGVAHRAAAAHARRTGRRPAILLPPPEDRSAALPGGTVGGREPGPGSGALDATRPRPRTRVRGSMLLPPREESP